MADYLDSANQTVQAQKVALLNAIAQGGTAGKQAYQQAQADVATQKQQAVKDALAAAAQRGAPEGASAGISSSISTPYDRRSLDISQAGATRQANFDSAAQRNGQFLDQSAAAVPALRELVDRKVTEMRGQAAAREAEAQQRAQDRAQAAADRQQARADRQARAEKPPTLGAIVSANGGPDFLGRQIKQILDANSMRPGFSMDPQGGSMKPDEVGSSIGLPPGYAGYLAGNSQAKQDAKAAKTAADVAKSDPNRMEDQVVGKSVGLSLQSVQNARNDAIYKAAAAAIQDGINQNLSMSDILSKIRSGPSYKSHPKTAEVALRDAFPPYVFSNGYTG